MKSIIVKLRAGWNAAKAAGGTSTENDSIKPSGRDGVMPDSAESGVSKTPGSTTSVPSNTKNETTMPNGKDSFIPEPVGSNMSPGSTENTEGVKAEPVIPPGSNTLDEHVMQAAVSNLYGVDQYRRQLAVDGSDLDGALRQIELTLARQLGRQVRPHRSTDQGRA